MSEIPCSHSNTITLPTADAIETSPLQWVRDHPASRVVCHDTQAHNLKLALLFLVIWDAEIYALIPIDHPTGVAHLLMDGWLQRNSEGKLVALNPREHILERSRSSALPSFGRHSLLHRVRRLRAIQLLSSDPDLAGHSAYASLESLEEQEPIEPRRYLEFTALSLKHQQLDAQLIHWAEVARQQRCKGVVSIVIPVRGSEMLICRCIAALLRTQSHYELDIVLVDNGNREAIQFALGDAARRHPNIRVLRHDANHGFAVACNHGFAHGCGEYTVFLNQDCEVEPSWLDSLLAPLHNPECIGVQPTLLDPLGNVNCLGVVFSDASPLGQSLFAGVPSSPDLMRDRKLQAVTGACMAVRSQQFADCFGFDPGYVNGQEDVDFCLRLSSMLGGYFLQTSRSVVWHLNHATKGRFRYVDGNRARFIERWRGSTFVDEDTFLAQGGYRRTGNIPSEHPQRPSWLRLNAPRLAAIDAKHLAGSHVP